MQHPDYKADYDAHVAQLMQRFTKDEALRVAVGGEFFAVGRLEYFLLLSLGLKPGDHVVDIGCGSGRLAVQLAPVRGLSYYGFDIVGELVAHARELCARRDWRIEVSSGEQIAEDSGVADYVCAFSVFTHLLHDDSFRYLREAYRVLKPGGSLVFSFLEFAEEYHWSNFVGANQGPGVKCHLNQFIEQSVIRIWAKRVGFEVAELRGGSDFCIPLAEEVIWDNGFRMEHHGSLGQSFAVLRKPRKDL